MRVRCTQIDGAIPNLALMRLAGWHRSRGDEVFWTRKPTRDFFEPAYSRVYASAIFQFSRAHVQAHLSCFPDSIVGGTWKKGGPTAEEATGMPESQKPDYSDHPAYPHSIGFTQRGCRLKCKFCVVPEKEGRAREASFIQDIWRGEGHARSLLLLDNDFFGAPEQAWSRRIEEIRDGGFLVSMIQGINVRHLSVKAAGALASIEYRNSKFTEKVLYTAYDNLKDERIFFRGIDMLEDAGIPPTHVMAYMLTGFDAAEDWTRIWRRFDAMVARGIRPYPMVFDCRATDPDRYRSLKRFQRWVITRMYEHIPFSAYDTGREVRHRAAAKRQGLEQDELQFDVLEAA